MFVRSVEDLENNDLQVTILENDEEVLASACLGHDDETDAVYSVLVALPRYLPKPNGREVQFDIIENIYEGGNELSYALKDGRETARFLRGADRAFTLECICAVVSLLVDIHKPDTIVMMTVTPNLPEAALRKYDTICASLRDVGYEGRRDSPFHGTQIWIMSRITHGT